MSDLTFHTRREFLRKTVLGGALSWTVPSFLANTFAVLHAEAADKSTQITTGRDATILVMLQMAGGNDGLNTVVPFANDHYRRARPRIGLSENKVLRLNDDLALHPSLTGLKDLYDGGQLSIIQGVGYPNPNRSHFRSTEIWQTACDAEQVERYGWLGRYFDNACTGCDPTVGVSVGRQMPQAFVARTPTGVTLENPESYRFIPPGRGRPTEMSATEESFRELNQPERRVSNQPLTHSGAQSAELDPATAEEMVGNSGGTVAALGGAVSHCGSALDFLERTALDAQVSSDTIRAIARRGASQATYPTSPLGNSLKLVAKLIGGGLKTRVFYVSQGGYDTHTNQTGTQERLLKDLGDSVQAFIGDVKAQGNMGRVLLLTFSEFGRRVAENANGGTDHGAAAPMFLIGEKVKAGLLGRYPSLAPADLFQGDLKYTVDFRSVYATVLERWLNTSSEPTLGKSFPLLPLV
jgi:uncharacterized protein (DUF1501 family)